MMPAELASRQDRNQECHTTRILDFLL